MASDNDDINYPYNLPSYISALDDGQLCTNELKEESTSWRSEKYPLDSNVLILDHDKGKGSYKYCNDAQIDKLLAAPQPQIRFILLQPTVHEKIAVEVHRNKDAAKVLKRNELGRPDDEKTGSRSDGFSSSEEANWIPDCLNISYRSLIKVLTQYDIAPAACSHIRGQEQIFGSRFSRGKDGEVANFEFWYAIRARMYIMAVNKDADLKITIITRYDVVTKKSLIILKYRSFNDLAENLKEELTAKLKEFVEQESTTLLAENPFALPLLHFNSTVQWYRRAARDPRDTVREEEVKAHETKTLTQIDMKRLHLTTGSLDQDRMQLDFILGVIKRLRVQHDLFQRLVNKKEKPEDRDWLYLRVEEELSRLENQLTYFRSSIMDVAIRAERLMDLLFKLLGQQNARWNAKLGKQAMQESASMKAIAVVSMLFLPGTFVAGILGANVFSMESSQPLSNDGSGSGKERLVVASQWWILLFAGGSLTLLTFIIWYWWKTVTSRKIDARLRDEEEL